MASIQDTDKFGLAVITYVPTLGDMVLELKLRKIGNSVGLVLPKEALAHLHADEGDSLTLTEGADGRLLLSTPKAAVSEQMRVAQDIMQRYRNTLRELAK